MTTTTPSPCIDFVLCEARKIGDNTESGIEIPDSVKEQLRKERSAELLTVVANGPVMKSPLPIGAKLLCRIVTPVPQVVHPNPALEYVVVKEHDLVLIVE